MLTPVIYSHFRLQHKALVAGRVSLPIPKKIYIHIGVSSVILHHFVTECHILGTHSLHQAPGSAESGADGEENFVHINAVKSVGVTCVVP